MSERRVTRASERKRRMEDGGGADLPDNDPPKPKRQTLGQHLQEEREKMVDKLEADQTVRKYVPYSNYEKSEVVGEFQAREVTLFQGQLFESPRGLKLIFLTLRTGPNPKTFTHFCNNISLKWNLKDLKIGSSRYQFKLPDVVMLFVRGEHVEGTDLESTSFKYVGLVGLKSVSSSRDDSGGGRTISSPLNSVIGGEYILIEASLGFDYVLSKKDLSHFGANVMRCKKNRFGSSLCA